LKSVKLEHDALDDKSSSLSLFESFLSVISAARSSLLLSSIVLLSLFSLMYRSGFGSLVRYREGLRGNRMSNVLQVMDQVVNSCAKQTYISHAECFWHFMTSASWGDLSDARKTNRYIVILLTSRAIKKKYICRYFLAVLGPTYIPSWPEPGAEMPASKGLSCCWSRLCTCH
jgi:hypothetical protein